jgi:hypothetical protein
LSDVRSDLERVLAQVGGELSRPLTLRAAVPGQALPLPDPLLALYSFCDGGDLAFGELSRAEECLQLQGVPPFSPRWIPFGRDRHFSFWLCAREPIRGLWFTAWDHEAGVHIEEPEWEGLGEFLGAQYEEALDTRSGRGDFLVLTQVPPAALPAAIVELKGLMGVGTHEARSVLDRLPAPVAVATATEARASLRRLRVRGVTCHLQLEGL